MREGKTKTPEPRKAVGGNKSPPLKPVTASSVTTNPLWDALALRVQPKLAVGSADDPLEREADRWAERVTSAESPFCVARGNPAQSSRLARLLRSSPDKLAPPGLDAPLASNSAVPHGELGRPLDDPHRAFFESRFHHDFS